jgi:hypothetical protein
VKQIQITRARRTTARTRSEVDLRTPSGRVLPF